MCLTLRAFLLTLQTTGESRASSSESREDEQSTDQDQDSELGNNNDERNEGSVSSQASSQVFASLDM